VICEVWHEPEQRWLLVDPDRKMVDFSPEQFEFSGDVWLRYKDDKLNPSSYGVPEWWGAHPILSVLCHDLASVLGNEHVYWEQPPVTSDSSMEVKNIPSAQVIVLNEVAVLLREPDSGFDELRRLYLMKYRSEITIRASRRFCYKHTSKPPILSSKPPTRSSSGLLR